MIFIRIFFLILAEPASIMGLAFKDIDPYEILEVQKDSNPIELKKSFKKLSLKYHPDKIQQRKSSDVEDKDHFSKIQFAYSVLSDPLKRQRYDRTGSLDDSELDEFFNWQEYFDNITNKITIEMIEEDRLKYQGSEEEKSDIITNFLYYDGDFLKIFEVIPHLEFDEQQEDRVFKIIEAEMQVPSFVESLDSSTFKAWEKYKKSRKTKVKTMLKKLAKEAKEAEELEKTIKLKGKKSPRNESDLKSIIQSRQANRLDDLISSLEAKHGAKKGKKRHENEISDEEFSKIQQSIVNLSKSKKLKKY